MERDAKLAAIYRAAPHDAPPPALDDAIRAAARRAVTAGPQPAGAPLRRWRVPLSIAAVLVLSVSLVTLMREQAPELAEPPRADVPESLTQVERKPAGAAVTAGESDSMIPKTLAPGFKEGDSVGLKPPQPAPAPGLGLRSNAGATVSTEDARHEMAADRAPSALAKRAPAEAFPGAAAPPGTTAGAATAKPERQAAEEESRRRDSSRLAEAPRAEPVPAQRSAEAVASAPAGVVDAKQPLKAQTANTDSAPREQAGARVQAGAATPAPKPAPSVVGAIQGYAKLPPDKWLEQVEALRKQGRIDEAKANFAEFRRRYPDHPLPDALKDWARP